MQESHKVSRVTVARAIAGLAAASVLAGAVVASPTCFDIVGSCTHAFVPGVQGYVAGGLCLASCGACFDQMIPGTQCQAVSSVGGPVTVACLKGYLSQNQDGTWACHTAGQGFWYGTKDADLICETACLGGGGGPN
jgi:hypothetical protein